MISIQLDRPHPLYLAGETLTGTVQWNDQRQQEEKPTLFFITFSGRAECGWSDTTCLHYSSSDLICFQQQADTFVTPLQPILRGVTVVEMDVLHNTTATVMEQYCVIQVLWWPRNHNSPVCLGQTIVERQSNDTNISSHRLTPHIHSDDQVQPHVHSIQLSLYPVTTIHSVSLQEPFVEGGSLQVTCHSIPSNNNKPKPTPFSFSVPYTAHPSFRWGRSQQARIHYSICAVLGNTQVQEQEIWVISQLPLPVPRLWRPTWTSRQVSLVTDRRWFFSNSDSSIAYQLGLSKRIYAPGEVLEFTPQTHVFNQTHELDIQITLRLIRILKCIVRDGYVRERVTTQSYPIRTLRGRFSKVLYPQETWEPQDDVLIIPSAPPCTDPRLCVQVSYKVQLHVRAVNSTETLAETQLPVYICALPPPEAPKVTNVQDAPWDPQESGQNCWESTAHDTSPLPDLCVLQTKSNAYWDVTIHGRAGVYSPHQFVWTMLNDDDEHSAEESPFKEEVVHFQTTVPDDDESISDPDDSHSPCSSSEDEN